MLENILYILKKIIPKSLFRSAQPFYHRSLALLGTLRYGFPSRKLSVVAVTGTKGKTTTTELVAALLEGAGHRVALLNTYQFKIAGRQTRNRHKMSTPGRFFVQHFLHRAVTAGCTHVVLEMTSEAAKQFRHIHIAYDALIFTNLSPEHIESHGSYEKYRDAKLSIGCALEHSSKKDRVLVVNSDDPESEHFLTLAVPLKYSFSPEQVTPFTCDKHGITFTLENTEIHSPLRGIFNLENILAAVTYVRSQGISLTSIRDTLQSFQGVRGRVEFVRLPENNPLAPQQNFNVVVDYAHTIDSLEKFYAVFAGEHNICILGNTGGGRDAWKREEMAHTAARHCSKVILTNEDPYNEDPRAIVETMEHAITEMPEHPPVEIIMDRRKAICTALERATGKRGSNVLITGKGTDPYIMEANNTKTPWDDASVAREELEALFDKSTKT